MTNDFRDIDYIHEIPIQTYSLSFPNVTHTPHENKTNQPCARLQFYRGDSCVGLKGTAFVRFLRDISRVHVGKMEFIVEFGVLFWRIQNWKSFEKNMKEKSQIMVHFTNPTLQ